jgi:energy-coupling factor transport system permease protein
MTQNLSIPVVYVPSNTFFHRLHPITKTVWAIGAVVLAFATRNPAFLLILFVFGLLFIMLAGVFRAYWKVMAVLFPISLSLIVFQAVAPAFPKPWVTIAALGPFTIYQEGIYSGFSLLLRTWAGTNFAVLLVLTTHPADMFTALQKVGLPYELNFMVSTSLQLIPIVQREFQIVLSAQRSRGMKATGFGSAIPSMVPVFAGTIERVQQLAMSLESRAFGSKGIKTSLREITSSPKDYVVGVLGLLVTGAGVYIALRYQTELDWSKTPFMPAWLSITVVLAAAVIFVYFTIALWWQASRE